MWKRPAPGKPGTGRFYGLYRLQKGKVLIGDYNVRYGQGLAFWSAFQLAGLSTLDAFSKRANGADYLVFYQFDHLSFHLADSFQWVNAFLQIKEMKLHPPDAHLSPAISSV
jgi:hypothetical protein